MWDSNDELFYLRIDYFYENLINNKLICKNKFLNYCIKYYLIEHLKIIIDSNEVDLSYIDENLIAIIII